MRSSAGVQWVDTNVIVRFLTHDDRAQTARAIIVMGRKNIRISKTVLLETAWVLRSLYDFPVEAIVEAMERLGGMQNVSFEDAAAILQAIALIRNGLDIEDALHVATCAQ